MFACNFDFSEAEETDTPDLATCFLVAASHARVHRRMQPFRKKAERDGADILRIDLERTTQSSPIVRLRRTSHFPLHNLQRVS